MKDKERKKRFNQEVSDLKCNEQLKVRHRVDVLTVKEVLDGRSSAYTFLKIDNL